MTSSNSRLAHLTKTTGARADPGFKVIVATEYYDGPEEGIALYPSGEAARFHALGDSRSRLFRAFAFTAVQGQWSSQVNALPEMSAVARNESTKILVTDNRGEEFERLDRQIRLARVSGRFVGFGPPTLEWLELLEVTAHQIEMLMSNGRDADIFQMVRKMFRRRPAERLPNS